MAVSSAPLPVTALRRVSLREVSPSTPSDCSCTVTDAVTCRNDPEIDRQPAGKDSWRDNDDQEGRQQEKVARANAGGNHFIEAIMWLGLNRRCIAERCVHVSRSSRANSLMPAMPMNALTSAISSGKRRSV